MAVKKPKAFHIYLDTYDHMQLLTMEQRGELLTALYEFAISGALTEFQNGSLRMAFSFMKAQISRDFEKYQEKCKTNKANASKRNRTQATVNDRKRPLPNANDGSQEEKEEEYKEEYKEEKEEDKEEENKNNISPSAAADAPTRTPYGLFHNVLLTEDELHRLKSRYPHDYEAKIERLSRYIESTGKHYSNHYATLLSWLEEDAAKKPQVERRASYDINELEKIDTLDFVDSPDFDQYFQRERRHIF